jgi:biotin carboxylase
MSSYLEGAYLFQGKPSIRQLALDLQGAFDTWGPELVIPGDDAAVQFLHLLCETRPQTTLSPGALEIIERSVGDLARLGEREKKSWLGQIAVRKGFSMPPQVVSPSVEEAHRFVRTHGLPVIAKADYTAAGQGVRICATEAELTDSLLKPISNNSDLYDRPVTITLQKFLAGATAGVALTALRGTTLAAFAYIKERTFPSGTGPASVVRIVDRPDMLAAAAQVVNYFGYTGLCGLDLIIEETSQKAYLIEFNGRPTPSCSLGALAGTDLLGAFFTALTGKPSPAPQPPCPPQTLIALFPNEWWRDKNSPYLRTAYHDVPWDDPKLLHHVINLR